MIGSNFKSFALPKDNIELTVRNVINRSPPDWSYSITCKRVPSISEGYGAHRVLKSNCRTNILTYQETDPLLGLRNVEAFP